MINAANCEQSRTCDRGARWVPFRNDQVFVDGEDRDAVETEGIIIPLISHDFEPELPSRLF